MGQLFTLSAQIKGVIAQAFDDLITELGKDCRIYYPGKPVACGNCIYDSLNGRGGLIYKHGGPIQFPNGTICPVCNGKELKISETSEVVELLCSWDPKKFWAPIPNLDIRKPSSILQTKGFIDPDMPKVIKADRLTFEIPLDGLTRQTYKLLSMPGDRSNIIQGRYFICNWEQI